MEVKTIQVKKCTLCGEEPKTLRGCCHIECPVRREMQLSVRDNNLKEILHTLSSQQIDAIVDWINTWDQLRRTAVPLRFREDATLK